MARDTIPSRMNHHQISYPHVRKVRAMWQPDLRVFRGKLVSGPICMEYCWNEAVLGSGSQLLQYHHVVLYKLYVAVRELLLFRMCSETEVRFG